MDSDSKGRAFRDGQVDALFKQHAVSLAAAVSIIKDLVPSSLEDVHIGKFAMKQKGESIPAKETTLVDAPCRGRRNNILIKLELCIKHEYSMIIRWGTRDQSI